MPDPIDAAFESLARAFLAEHPEVVHEWRSVKHWWGSRRDLVCAPDSPAEVYASLLSGQIAVGDRTHHTDFGDFGRGLSHEAVAREAVEYLIELLEQHGLSTARPRRNSGALGGTHASE